MSFSTLDKTTLNGSLNKTLQHAGDYIESCQQDSGAILWFNQGKLDPWDHSEAIMGLTLSGKFDAAKQGFLWLRTHQNSDGSWYTKYYGDDSAPLDRAKIESNFVAYPATALWHYYLVTNDKGFVLEQLPWIRKAIDKVVSLQNNEGDIQWAESLEEDLPKDALVTACASITRSLESAINLARLEGEIPKAWVIAHQELSDTLKNKPWRFDRTWESKARFSMDWFYPILAGIYSPEEARLRLEERWDEFVKPGIGCRCVSDEPWVTIAESCELCLALIAAGQTQSAEKLLSQLMQWQDKDGGFWTGYSFRDQVIWPQEKPSWTAAAVLLAADALYKISPAATLFIQPHNVKA